jgi:WhiB family redox-sensing transcriptional regulator
MTNYMEMPDFFNKEKGATPCSEADPDGFFPEQGEQHLGRLAKKICKTCPYQPECLDWALKNDEEIGIWGGSSEQERRQIRTGKLKKEDLSFS